MKVSHLGSKQVGVNGGARVAQGSGFTRGGGSVRREAYPATGPWAFQGGVHLSRVPWKKKRHMQMVSLAL